MRLRNDAMVAQMNALRNDLREAHALIAKQQAEYEQLAQRRNRDVKALLRALHKSFQEIATLKAQRGPARPAPAAAGDHLPRSDADQDAAIDREFISVDFATLNDGSVSFGN